MKTLKPIILIFFLSILFSCNNYYEIYLEIPDDTDVLTTNTDLETLQEKIIGKWEGEAIPPSNWADPYSVNIEFKADGTYSAKNISSKSSVPAFYYGIDDDSDLKIFDVYNLYSTGKAVANITILFQAGTTNTGKLDFITISQDSNQLSFEFWKGNYGPFHYNLTRK